MPFSVWRIKYVKIKNLIDDLFGVKKIQIKILCDKKVFSRQKSSELMPFLASKFKYVKNLEINWFYFSVKILNSNKSQQQNVLNFRGLSKTSTKIC